MRAGLQGPAADCGGNRRFAALGKLPFKARAYRFGYGVLDENLNFQVDPTEKKVYFEVSDFATCVFFENPR